MKQVYIYFFNLHPDVDFTLILIINIFMMIYCIITCS